MIVLQAFIAITFPSYPSWVATYSHPIFLLQVQDLIRQVERLKRKHPATYRKKNATRHLAAIATLIFEVKQTQPALNTIKVRR